MCIHKYLARFSLLGYLVILSSCSEGGSGDRPSLNADDLWDRLDEERQKPLPDGQEKSQSPDSREILSDSLPVVSPEILSIADIKSYEESLQTAEEKYQVIAAALDAGFIALENVGGSARDRQDKWRTIQLYLSRLTNLQKSMDRAINIVEDNHIDNQRLLMQSRELLVVVADRISRTRSRLDTIAPPE